MSIRRQSSVYEFAPFQALSCQSTKVLFETELKECSHHSCSVLYDVRKICNFYLLTTEVALKQNECLSIVLENFIFFNVNVGAFFVQLCKLLFFFRPSADLRKL